MKISFFSLAILLVALLAPALVQGQPAYPAMPEIPAFPPEFELPLEQRIIFPGCAPPAEYFAFLAEGENAGHVAPDGGMHMRWHATAPSSCSGADFTVQIWKDLTWPEELSGTIGHWFADYDQTRFSGLYPEDGGECSAVLQIYRPELGTDPKINLFVLPTGSSQGWRDLTFQWPAHYQPGEIVFLEVRTMRHTEAACGWVESMDRHFLEALGLVPVAIEPSPDGVPGTHNLSAVYPNPFNPQAQFTLEVAQMQSVRIVVYDALGREASTLFNGTLTAGLEHAFTIDGAGLPSGVYRVRAIGEHFTDVRAVTLMK